MNSRQNFIFFHFKQILNNYEGKLPFHHFFKNYCQANKALGSKDRKILKEIIYSVFRSGFWGKQNFDKLFLLPNKPDSTQFINEFYINLPQNNNKLIIDYPYKDWLNSDFNNIEYFESFAEQPLVWIRIKDKNLDFYSKILADDLIEKIKIYDKFWALGLKPSVKLNNDDPNYDIQDLSSQIAASKIKVKENQKVWDCCSGAGGKSLFVSQNFDNFKLYATDKRISILKNLNSRFIKNKLIAPEIAELDLEQNIDNLNFNGKNFGNDFFDVIIADVPCSGSGTWGREPENLYFFTREKLENYTQKQFNIASNTLKFLKTGGMFYYITCSVFEEENFGIINKLSQETSIEILNYEYINGYKLRADNMFVAEILKK